MIKSVNIIGAGNVAHHLMMHLNGAVEIKSIFSRQLDKALKLSNICGCYAIDNLSELEIVDLNIICVSDGAISEVAKQLDPSTPVVHTGGAISMQDLARMDKFGIMYPLQTFSVDRAVDMTKVPFLLESSSEEFGKELAEFVNAKISPNVLFKDSRERKEIHLAAVFLSNFTVQLVRESNELLKKDGHDQSLLVPLLRETMAKVLDLGAEGALTGPAKRKDSGTIDEHLNMISDQDLKEIYRLISNRITATT